MDKHVRCKEQLYPLNKDEQWLYRFSGAEFVPSKDDVFKIYVLINRLRNSKLDLKNQFYSSKQDDVKDFLRDIYGNNTTAFAKDLKIDLIKGSIYKIKKYFLENNNLKEIRGGSIIIDYLNNEVVEEILEDQGFNNENIIYCGGGNILIAVPEGYGDVICRKLESRFRDISLTAMNAFEFINTNFNELAFNYKDIARKVNDKLEERKKMKLYEVNPDSSLEKVRIKDKRISFLENVYPLKYNRAVCDFCDIRDAKYTLKENREEKSICPSCLRKHRVGQGKGIFVEEYKKYTNSHMNQIDSIIELGEEIAVIYGDGNNMGKVVMDIENIFEMMYFSRKTDSITKNAVYKSLKKVMREDVRFEVIALGGDDIFIIVPAEYAYAISTSIIDEFDKAFDFKITMSIGIAISKSTTPIASLFSIAQKQLKDAKEMVKKQNLKEGTIDIIEILGDMHISNVGTKREFPLSNSQFRKYVDSIKDFKRKTKMKTQLYKLRYAQQSMIEDEFNLFYQYQDSKKGKDEYQIQELIKSIYGDKTEKIDSPYKICWDDLILIWKRI